MIDEFVCRICGFPTYYLDENAEAFCSKICMTRLRQDDQGILAAEEQPQMLTLRVFPFLQLPLRLPFETLSEAFISGKFDAIEALVRRELSLERLELDRGNFSVNRSRSLIAQEMVFMMAPSEQYRLIMRAPPFENNSFGNLMDLLSHGTVKNSPLRTQEHLDSLWQSLMLEREREARRRPIDTTRLYWEVILSPYYSALLSEHAYLYDIQPLTAPSESTPHVPLPPLDDAQCATRIQVVLYRSLENYDYDDDSDASEASPLENESDPIYDVLDLRYEEDTFGLDNFFWADAISLVAYTAPEEGGEVVGYITGRVASRFYEAYVHPELDDIVRVISDALIEKTVSRLRSPRMLSLLRHKMNNCFLIDGLYVRPKFRRLDVARILSIHLLDVLYRHRVDLALSHVMLDSASWATASIFEGLQGHYFGAGFGTDHFIQEDYKQLRRVIAIYDHQSPMEFNTLLSLEDADFIQALAASIEAFSRCAYAYQKADRGQRRLPNRKRPSEEREEEEEPIVEA